MQRRYNLAHLILGGVVVLGLTPLMVVVDAQGQIAFHSDRDGNVEIYVMDADGGNQRNLTNNRHRDWKPSWSPSWSPDGKRIAFMSERNGNAEIYVMDADGGNPQNLTNNRHRDVNPAWLNSPFSVSPAGKKFTMWGRLKQIDR